MDLWRRLTTKGSVPKHLAHTSSRCVAESVSGTHDFMVENYSQVRDLPEGNYVLSDTFSIGGYDWFLCFFPGGTSSADTLRREEYEDYTAASVHLLQRGETAVVATARVTIGLVDRHRTLASRTTSDAYNFFSVKGLDFHKSVLKSKLTLRRYLKDDCLTIRCVLTVITPRTEATKARPAAAAPLPDLHGDLKRMLSDAKGTDTVDALFISTVDGDVEHC